MLSIKHFKVIIIRAGSWKKRGRNLGCVKLSLLESLILIAAFPMIIIWDHSLERAERLFCGWKCVAGLYCLLPLAFSFWSCVVDIERKRVKYTTMTVRLEVLSSRLCCISTAGVFHLTVVSAAGIMFTGEIKLICCTEETTLELWTLCPFAPMCSLESIHVG